MPTTDHFWPDGARLAVSFSLMFEGGGQPISGAPGFIEEPIQKGLPDLATNGIFQYGVYEGIPRILDLMDKHQVKLSCFMIGQAVDKAPDLAREIVKRGHEAAAHGRSWRNSYLLDPDAERRFIADGVESIQKATGQTPIGWNAYYVRNSPHTLDILQSLGFKYHIDEPSADEPFIIKLKGGDFVTVPYTLHMNDIASFTFVGWNPAAYEQALKDEFDQLYEEGAYRRRMMVVGLHDRISGHANRVRAVQARRLVCPQGRNRGLGARTLRNNADLRPRRAYCHRPAWLCGLGKGDRRTRRTHGLSKREDHKCITT
jgi:peptidoglycan/xylan/chitin deacetylase (PgdA/CDA1 family)